MTLTYDYREAPISKLVSVHMKTKAGVFKFLQFDERFRKAPLRNRPQVSMVYRLINHAGCWKNTRRICKSRAAGE